MQMSMEMLVVIKVQPEEGGGGAVHATLVELHNSVAQGVSHLGQWHVVVLMWVKDRWTGAQRCWWT